MAHEGPLFFGVCPASEEAGEIWLPGRALHCGNTPREENLKAVEQPQFPYEFPYEWNLPIESALSSPVESISGSNPTESEEDDDFMAGLAEQIAHSMLDDDENAEVKAEANGGSWDFQNRNLWASDARKAPLAVSPQSTLPGFGSWSTRSWSRSSAASSNGSSQVSSPHSTQLEVANEAWDLLYAAAGEVVRLKVNDGLLRTSATCLPPKSGCHQLASGPVSRLDQRRQAPWTHAQELPARSSSFASNFSSAYSREKATSSAHYYQRSLSAQSRDEDRKLSGYQIRNAKHGAVPDWRRHSRPILQYPGSCGARGVNKSGAGQRALWGPEASSSSHWPPSQGGSGMRAVFLGANGSGRESGGTGVFLPRRAGSGHDSKRKPVCSTVLLPSRIVQALKLNVEDMRVPPMTSKGFMQTNVSQKDVAGSLSASPVAFSVGLSGSSQTLLGRDDFVDSQWKPAYPSCASLQPAAPEASLPTEWTY